MRRWVEIGTAPYSTLIRFTRGCGGEFYGRIIEAFRRLSGANVRGGGDGPSRAARPERHNIQRNTANKTFVSAPAAAIGGCC